MSKDTDERTTPDDLWLPIREVFNPDLDAASTDENALCQAHFTKESNGLLQSWKPYSCVFLNPPYSNEQIEVWTRKVVQEGVLTVMVLPNDSSTDWYNYLINNVDFIHAPNRRYKFNKMDTSAKFSTLIAVLNSSSYFVALEFAIELHKKINGLTSGENIWMPPKRKK